MLHILVIWDEVVLYVKWSLLSDISKIGKATMFGIESTNAVYL